MKVVFTGKLVRGVPVPDDPGRVAGALSKFKPGASLEFIIQTPRHPRTLDQNARYWVMVEAYLQMVDQYGWTEEDVHEHFCKTFLRPRIKAKPDGTMVEIPQRSSGLSTIEFATFMDKVEQHLNESGIYFPEGA